MDVKTLNHVQMHETPWHAHQAGQLYWLQRGIIIIETSFAQWPITPGSVGWIPENCAHKAKILASVQGYMLYLDNADGVVFPQSPGIYGVNAFLSALMQRATCLNDSDDYSPSYISHLVALLGHEITMLNMLPIGLPLPSDRRARHIADELLHCPATDLTQTQLATRAGMSVRTLSRIFTQQTGLTFSQWRQQSKIVISLKWLLAGLPISDVAERSGYHNVSAYIEVFRQRFGETPGKFQAKLD
ncbi:helix-turn-helix transcriptional regulator [Vibrio gazogenes]|uniref:AraC-type DNA-binding protein n=1 Tax=Vibrio gazogenes DSM 21264 = NBRC 103151 TaxID=1123492 RepID=A0A1M4UKU8_VIBGA|nr:helix-turn-helix transcriptional regulator [Vibrio gazogenes]USP15748.1 helix-turn-helix transcriptional regulator [Vibrio gazogenes]SHE57278.1 AraC-type DNA-binding protein [Vibrio gazogenes DSM 21264] [Vibrio gazogenes DSM 21264 = NBRC 103151]SJN52717.1 HTH-type transcriptional repressor of iron proteins A [Vibrio gazogenes]